MFMLCKFTICTIHAIDLYGQIHTIIKKKNFCIVYTEWSVCKILQSAREVRFFFFGFYFLQ